MIRLSRDWSRGIRSIFFAECNFLCIEERGRDSHLVKPVRIKGNQLNVLKAGT
jgi:hypothetical protein